MKKRKSICIVLFVFLLVGSINNSCLCGSPPKENTWTTETSTPTSQADRAAVVKGKIYFIGNEFNYEYDHRTGNWSTKTPMPTVRWSFGVAVYDNRIYTVGGVKGIGEEAYQATELEVYDPLIDSWESRQPLPISRSRYSLTSIVGDKIHVIGTQFGSVAHDIYCISNDSWSNGALVPYPDYAYGSAVIDNKIYVMGLTGTMIYDSITDSWSYGAKPPVYVRFSGVCATTGTFAPERIYVFGGALQLLEYSDATQVYDPVSDTWSLGAPMLSSRGGTTTAVIDDFIYLLGGMAISWGGSGLTNNEKYVPFGYGTVAPVISLVSPENKMTYTSSNVSIAYSVNRAVQSIKYSLDGQSNVTVDGNFSLTGLEVGSHNITLYAQDIWDNVGASKTISFTTTSKDFFGEILIIAIIVVAIFGVSSIVISKKHKH